MLTVSSETRAALDADHVHAAWLLDLPGGLTWTTHDRPISLAGVNYASVGQVLSLPTIPRVREVRQHGLSIILAAVEPAVEDHFRGTPGQQTLIGGLVRVRLVLLDGAGGVIAGEAINLYEGTLDHWTVEDGQDDAKLTIKVIGPWSKPTQTAGRYVTQASQAEVSETDRFMDFAHEQIDNLPWGAEEDD